jgi:hypothetical protein
LTKSPFAIVILEEKKLDSIGLKDQKIVQDSFKLFNLQNNFIAHIIAKRSKLYANSTIISIKSKLSF